MMRTLVIFALFIIHTAGLFAGGWDAGASSLPVPAVTAPAAADITSPFAPADAAVSGFLNDRIRVHLTNRMLRIDEDVLLGGFRKKPGIHPWIGEHAGKWLHASCLLRQWSHDALLREKIERVAQGLIAAQEPDGYLGTYEPAKRLGKAVYSDWDVWAHKYNLIGLLSYYGISGNADALAACRKAGDLLVTTFTDKQDIVRSGPHAGMASLSVLESIVLLYRATGDKRYLNFAQHIVDASEADHGPKLISTMLRDKTVTSVGNAKAYEMLSCYVGLAELYRATGDAKYFDVLSLVWDDVAKHRLYITGSASTKEHFVKDGELPNDAAARIMETCVTVTWMQLSWHMLRFTGDEKYAAALEKTVFNQLLGAQCPDGSCFAYYNPIDGLKEFAENYPPANMTCCNSSGPRGLALALTFLATADKDGLRINTFAPCVWKISANGTPVTVSLAGAFPANGSGSIAVTPEKETSFTLSLRIPRWTDAPSVTVNGSPVAVTAGSYVRISRTWKKGDAIAFSFPFRLAVREGDGSNKDLRAVTYGPLVYAADTSDNAVAPRFTALDTKNAITFRSAPAAGRKAWRDEVFLETDAIDLIKAKRGDTTPFTLVLRPFFDAGSWKSLFTVWMKSPGYQLAGISPFMMGREIFSEPGNVNGFISDGDAGTFRVSYNAKAQAEAYFGVAVDAPVTVSRAVYTAGNIFHDGGWFDASKGKPRFEVKRTADGPWESLGEFASFPETTSTDARGLKPGTKFELSFTPAAVVAIRVIGVPACGDKPLQAFASCADILAYE